METDGPLQIVICRCFKDPEKMKTDDTGTLKGAFHIQADRWQKSKSICLVGVWSMTIRLKTITMMSNLVHFYLNVFVGGFRVD